MANWTQVDILTSTEGIEVLSALLTEMNLGSLVIQDAADFEEFLQGKDVYWDYIEDSLMELTKAPTMVTVYLSDLAQGREQMELLEQRLADLRQMDEDGRWGPLIFTEKTVNEEDWETAWKQYYHPVEIGRRIIICPTWEECTPRPEQIVVSMDPGMAFGTGTHESTKLCLEELDALSVGGERVLDIGCGSGILAISALLLGAESADGVDIDQVAVEVATKNAQVNQVDTKADFRRGSFTQFATGKYEIIFANIVADAIKALAPDVPNFLAANGSFITSGIIDTRGKEVKMALEEAGLVVVVTKEEAGWVAMRAMLGATGRGE